MDNELISHKNWFRRNWKWSLFVFLIASAGTVLLMLSANGSIDDFAMAYADNDLYDHAIDQANRNEGVIAEFGKLEPIDKLAVLEGNTVYSNDRTSVESTVRITGASNGGKMDISATKHDGKWHYKNIIVRKGPAKIEVVKTN